MSRRTERIGNLIRSVVSKAIQTRLNDPRIAALTSITRVDVSADFSVAHVHVSVMANEARQKLCLAALQRSTGRLRAEVGQQIRLRHVPRLDFHLDDSLQRAFETVQVIDEAMAELGEPLPWETDDEVDAPTDAPRDPAARRKPSEPAAASPPDDTTAEARGSMDPNDGQEDG